MKKLLALLLLLGSTCAAGAQVNCTSSLTETAILSSFADNTINAITPRNLRDFVCSNVAGITPFTSLSVSGPATFSGLTNFTSLATFTGGISSNAITTATESASTITATSGVIIGTTTPPIASQPFTIHVGTNANTVAGLSNGGVVWTNVNDANNTFVPLTLDGSSIILQGTGVTIFTATSGIQIGNPTGGDKGIGTLNVSGSYYANGTVGVTCSGSPSSLFAITSGIVTHC